ncbi:hypothetical protein CI238_08203, partial [Colletotrichum incanum]
LRCCRCQMRLQEVASGPGKTSRVTLRQVRRGPCLSGSLSLGRCWECPICPAAVTRSRVDRADAPCPLPWEAFLPAQKATYADMGCRRLSQLTGHGAQYHLSVFHLKASRERC